MSRKSATNVVFALRVLMEKLREGQKEFHFVFVDLEKAHDRMLREKLWYGMRKSGACEGVAGHARGQRDSAVGVADVFKVGVGLHEGLALILFFIAVDNREADRRGQTGVSVNYDISK